MADNFRSTNNQNGRTQSHFQTKAENAAFTKQTSTANKRHNSHIAKFPAFGSQTKHEARFFSSVNKNNKKGPNGYNNKIVSDYYQNQEFGQV